MHTDENTLLTIQQLGVRLSRVFAGLCFAALLLFAVVGFISQKQTANRLAAEVAQRQAALDTAKHDQEMLTAELAGLNDPVRYAQYATLVGRHTLLLARPGETLVLVTWTGSDGAPITVRTTDWKLILHAAGIPTT